MSQTMIYLDHNATTPVRPEVIECMSEILQSPYNASSIHGFGREAKSIVESARKQIAKHIDAEGAAILFTSSGTEANNLALHGLKQVDAIAVSAIEHVSILEPASAKNAAIIPVDQQGVVQLDALEEVLSASDSRMLVSVMLANNETGIIQDIPAIVSLVLKYKGYTHVDASQALGKIPLSFNELGADMMTISGHKCGASQGVGALVIKKGIVLNPLFKGGAQEQFMRAGTENVAAIAGFAKALEVNELVTSEIRDYIESSLKTTYPELKIASEGANRLPNTAAITMPNVESHTQLMHFDLNQIAVSAGAACSSGRLTASHVLLAMDYSKQDANATIRVSVGRDTTKEDADAFIAAWQKLAEKKGAFNRNDVTSTTQITNNTVQQQAVI